MPECRHPCRRRRPPESSALSRDTVGQQQLQHHDQAPRQNKHADDVARLATQPDAKQRKTLAERAVEYPPSATPAPRTFNKGVSLASQSGVSSACNVPCRCCFEEPIVLEHRDHEQSSIFPVHISFSKKHRPESPVTSDEHSRRPYGGSHRTVAPAASRPRQMADDKCTG